MKRILVFALCTMVMTSCEKFLEVEPTDFLAPSTYYRTPQHLEYALNGVYDMLGSTKLYGAQLHSRHNMQAEEGFYYSTATANMTETYDFEATNGEVEKLWEYLYIGVSRANIVLANVDNNKAIDEDIRKRIKGEALFLRAYYYFLLVQTYGPVPLRLEPTNSPDDVDMAASSEQDIYEQIIADMEEAEGLVLPISQIGFGGRVSKSAVRGILARVCLNMAGHPVQDQSKYQKANYWLEKIILDVDNVHTLNPSYSDVFIKYAADEYDIKESIWEVEFFGNSSGAIQESGYVGSWIGVRNTATSNDIGYSFGRIRATAKHYKLYEDGDVRRDWNIAPFTYAANGSKTALNLSQPAHYYVRYAGKYRREFEKVFPKSTQLTPINFPLLRYSDVLLMYAEVQNELYGQPTSEAIDAITAVRKRAWSSGIKSVSITNGGTGYTTTNLPTVEFVGGGGSGAVAKVTVASGKISAITFDRDSETFLLKNGKNYSAIPVITISGGSGSGATATAQIYNTSDYELTPLQKTNTKEFRKLIIDERTRELCFEALRRPDLIRWGIFYTTMKDNLAIMETDLGSATTIWETSTYRNVLPKHVIYPIPSKELEVNRKLVQHYLWR
ncbi:RagB/SusD family nutrient uptake outer membrane protein [Pseudopedobacter beijingensis]|uniref:RagB/SusD family nutrient uptake outer membrane protein n=1 Tax=Pseudopedobacter beijingensis TaxID=1207056 RepID=A0ABW4I9Q8_9SPHI